MFKKKDDGFCIIPDFSRSLPVADPEQRELFISLGCAAETAMIAAGFYGYRTVLNINAFSTDFSIKISLQKDDTVEHPELFSYINVRQTTRNHYADKPILSEDIAALKNVGDGITIRFFIGQNEIQQFSPFVAEANAIQMSNPKFKKELIQWVCFSEKEAMQKGDGLYTACSGMPAMGRMFGSFAFKNFVTVRSENKRLISQLENTAAVAIFTTPGNELEHWVKTGMVFQRFALTATKLGLNHSYINSPCQIPQVRDRMMNDLGLDGFPQLLIRLGYSQKMPFSFRRRINDVILKVS
ncbi:MAG: hypothetical protein JJU13_02190 [Balneolaceae bacterium]|nr:hypothetical protein [Balneolaceae bacterium]